jgi:hypothetical protein
VQLDEELSVKGSHRKVWNGSDLLAPGEYAYLPGDGWYACTPNGHLANLTQHDVTYDKEENVITVAPSIRIFDYSVSGAELDSTLYHGDIVRGVWREC